MIYKDQKGFSLIELAIVLAVLGLFIGGAISVYSRWLEKSQFEQAAEEIELAKKAIIGFTIVNNYLPCSDNVLITNLNGGNGIENRTAGNCTPLIADQTRTLPYATLGLSFQEDPWGNPYGYHAAPNYTNDVVGSRFTLTTGAVAAVGDTLIIDDGAAAPIVVANQVAFVIYSLGPDQGNNLTIQQEENLQVGPDDGTPGNYDERFSSSTYLPYDDQGTAALNDDTGFDDIISWVSTHVLKLHMVEAERLP